MYRPSTLAMILAGGRVDELGVLTHYRPKSAVPFGGFARVIDFPLSNLLQSGIERVAILSQYRSYSLINHIGTGAAWDMIGRNRGISILPPFKDYDNSYWYRGSADAVYQNLDFIQYHDPSVILILSGDHIYQMDYRKMIRYHNEQDADLTAAFIEVPPESASRFGVAEIADEGPVGGRVLSYEEKPTSPKGCWASLTVFCFRPEVLYKELEKNQQTDSYEFGRDIIPKMMEQHYKICGYKFNGYWGYTRTIDEYWQTSMDLLGPEPKIDLEAWGLRTNLCHRNIGDRQPVKIGPHGVLDNSMVYNGSIIEGTVRNSIIFPGVHVKAGAEVNDSIIFFDNIIHPGAKLHRMVSDVNTVFNRNVRVGAPNCEKPSRITVIGWNNNIPEDQQIGCGCRVDPRIAPEKWPKTKLEDGEELR
ncbi:glucose-1-phosphate adenylyltransferase family protein [Desulfobulbus oligotrophicus]|uniref:Glucose-1-phosphate adenylyltransferase n=1 Tax=Desulfobulbus oligotrophicus TaxID=1909699 RepID=A0A7T5VBJ8_9BACT|nr:sugar phosphate nucleotidyltransferase [Desulfobulbus oligotrophicus]QQG64766.1 glucose-1-phosphate adenylyltransferase [Desulfobulbus oligotrophicus]